MSRSDPYEVKKMVGNLETVGALALRPREAAKCLGISQRSLWSLTSPRGPIRSKQAGSGNRRMVLYAVDELQRWLKSDDDERSQGGPTNG